MKSKKEKESAKGGPSNKGKHTTCSPLPSLTPKVTRFLEEHYEASYKYIYAKKEMIKLKYVDMAWLKSERFAFLELIEYHELQKLVERHLLPYFDKVFYTTTHIDGDIAYLCAEVKGK